MVFVAFLLLTVSTIAVLGKGVLTGLDLKQCKNIGDNTYCGGKPPTDYPQPEIDKLADEGKLKHLKPLKLGAHLIDSPDLEDWSIEGNCAVDIIPDFKPYTLKKGNKTYHIVQSRFFNQTIPLVQCNEKNKREALDDERYNFECFKDFIPSPTESGFNTECVQHTVTTSFYVYIDGDISNVMGEIDADCICARTYIY